MCYCNVLVQYSLVQGYCLCVTVMCWCSTVVYRVTVVCVTVMCWFSTVGYSVTVVCDTLMCWCSTVVYRVTVLCVCYCNVLVQYSCVHG